MNTFKKSMMLAIVTFSLVMFSSCRGGASADVDVDKDGVQVNTGVEAETQE